MNIIDGKKIGDQILSDLKAEVSGFKVKPKLVDVLVGNDPVIESYVKIKAKRAMEIGISFEICNFSASISEDQLVSEISALNLKPTVCGLIVQLPLPEGVDKNRILDCINPNIDVDVMTALNLGKFFAGTSTLLPPTASAIMRILDEQQIELRGKKVLVIGAGFLVGRPVSLMLLQRDATLMVANSETRNLAELCLQADVIIAGTGTPGLIKADMVKDGAILIDAGTAESKGVIKGDVDLESMAQKDVYITPVPGGVGPVTIAMLLSNVVQRARETH